MTKIPWNPLASALTRITQGPGNATQGGGQDFQARLNGLAARGGLPEGQPLDSRALATLARLVQQRLAYGGMATLSGQGGGSLSGTGGMGMLARLSARGVAGLPGARRGAQPSGVSEILSRALGEERSSAHQGPGPGGGAGETPASASPEGSDSPRREAAPSPEAAADGAGPAGADPYGDLIREAADRYDLPEGLIRSVIRVESDFQPDAVSGAGAQGLMQLMPDTAQDLGVTDPLDPRQNIMAGSRYLKRLLGRYDGDRDMALAAYNWGMGNLERRPEAMPDETVRYVHKVNSLLA